MALSFTLDELHSMFPEYRRLLCLNQSQTAQVLGVSVGSLDNWRKEGLGPEYKKIDNGKKGRILYPKTAILEWISQTTKTA